MSSQPSLGATGPTGAATSTAVRFSESGFYESYSWCLNAFPTVPEAAGYLRAEFDKLTSTCPEWQLREIRLNIFLLASLISDTVDDYLLGPRYDFSRAWNVFRPARLFANPIKKVQSVAAGVRAYRLRSLWAWRDEWEEAVSPLAEPSALAGGAVADTAPRVRSLLDRGFPRELLGIPAKIPAAFRSQDLTHFDVHALGRKFIAACPDRDRPVLVVGLRTAGSYFAPLLRSFLRSEGYQDAAAVTLRPKTGLGAREGAVLRRYVGKNALAAVIDEPVYSASTVTRALSRLKEAGFHQRDIVALFPVHPHRLDWNSGPARYSLSKVRVFTLEPQEWHKASLLEAEAVRERLSEYLGTNVASAAAVESSEREIAAGQEPGFHCRLKRVYKVHTPGCRLESRQVFAKSCGWGWLGYHAFLAAARLGPSVPRLIGLRDGILFTEWIPEQAFDKTGRAELVESAASYIASRAASLALPDDPTPRMALHGRHRGTEELAAVLSGAYKSKIAAALKRPRIQRQLASLPCDRPALIDGRMRQLEWVLDAGRFVKTDFEHHGMGKHQLNVTDPAYDLADTILHWKLSSDEEARLLDAYIRQSGDHSVVERLFLHKLLAGTWALARAIDGLKDASLANRHAEFNSRYLNAWQFLTIHTTRFCGSLVTRPGEVSWRPPLVVLDVDGVLDKQVFGFPSSSAAGIQALSLLASRGYVVCLNTARSVSEVKEYCNAYGFAGGVAEYGACVWDAVNGRERVLVSDESLEQLDHIRNALGQLPGVFVNDSYRYSVKAYSFARDTTVPLPEMQVKVLLAELGLDRLQLHQTYSDSTVTASETDKGVGLVELLSLAGCPGAETIAVGDTEPDVPMFRVATRSYAPGHVSCPDEARSAGCRIATRAWQNGLLEIAKQIAHGNGRVPSGCLPPRAPRGPWDELFVRLLSAADRSGPALLLRSIVDPMAMQAFQK